MTQNTDLTKQRSEIFNKYKLLLEYCDVQKSLAISELEHKLFKDNYHQGIHTLVCMEAILSNKDVEEIDPINSQSYKTLETEIKNAGFLSVLPIGNVPLIKQESESVRVSKYADMLAFILFEIPLSEDTTITIREVINNPNSNWEKVFVIPRGSAFFKLPEPIPSCWDDIPSMQIKGLPDKASVWGFFVKAEDR
jgi:hypothetical protein